LEVEEEVVEFLGDPFFAGSAGVSNGESNADWVFNPEILDDLLLAAGIRRTGAPRRITIGRW
jgi:hypothetical protein